MAFSHSKQTGHLKIQHFASPEEFQPIGLLEIERQSAHEPRSFSLTRAITALPGSLVIFERTSARNLNASINAKGCVVLLPLNSAAQASLNSQHWDGSAIGLFRNKAPFCLREPCENTYAVIRFTSDMQNRGWAETEGRLHLSSIDKERLSKVQNTLTEVEAFARASRSERHLSLAATALHETVISALDSVLSADEMSTWRLGSFDRHLKLVGRLEELILASPSVPLYSETLAAEIGTSIRTLQTATKAVHGLSLHQYLRTRRLWALRAQLARGMPTVTVSSAAIANGFWHMGELSRLYKNTFGESPSETLQRGMRT
jgi:AraC-like DNA-binding protein